MDFSRGLGQSGSHILPPKRNKAADGKAKSKSVCRHGVVRACVKIMSVTKKCESETNFSEIWAASHAFAVGSEFSNKLLKREIILLLVNSLDLQLQIAQLDIQRLQYQPSPLEVFVYN